MALSAAFVEADIADQSAGRELFDWHAGRGEVGPQDAELLVSSMRIIPRWGMR
jgi:hypothetical protein